MVADDLRDPNTPPDVVLSPEAPRPVVDPTLGIKVDAPDGPVRHRLVTVGDSLTHGFRSLRDLRHARTPTRRCWRARSGSGRDSATRRLRRPLRRPAVESRMAVPRAPKTTSVLRSTGLSGSKRSCKVARAAREHTRTTASARLARASRNPGASTITSDLRLGPARHALPRRERDPGRDDARQGRPVDPLPDNSVAIAALRVLDSARDPAASLTPLEAAGELGEEGIETLIVWLGANNALGTSSSLKAKWSGPDYDDLEDKNALQRLEPGPLRLGAQEGGRRRPPVAARHVLWATIPHVTIAPLAKGVGERAGGLALLPVLRPPVGRGRRTSAAPGPLSAAHRPRRRGHRQRDRLVQPGIVAAVERARQRRAGLGRGGHRRRARAAGREALSGRVRGGAPVVVGRACRTRCRRSLERALGFRPTPSSCAGRASGRAGRARRPRRRPPDVRGVRRRGARVPRR